MNNQTEEREPSILEYAITISAIVLLTIGVLIVKVLGLQSNNDNQEDILDDDN